MSKNHKEFSNKINSLNFNELDSELQKKVHFTKLVIEIINKFDDNEFTADHVFSAIKKIGFNEKTDKSIKAQISTTLNKMKKNGYIECTFFGSGKFLTFKKSPSLNLCFGTKNNQES